MKSSETFHFNIDIGVDLKFPKKNVIRSDIHTALFLFELKEWAHLIEINLKSIIEIKEHRFLALELLHHYQYLNEKNFINLPCTDLIIHRVRLMSETVFSSLPQIRWPVHTEWWFKKLVSNELKEGIYEHTKKKDGHLSRWNAKAVLIDKVENPSFVDESRLTFDYFRVHEELSGTYVKFSFKTHDNFFNFSHGCLFSADLKHAYFIINLDEEARHLFVFIISGMRQLQSIRMFQGFKSASFTMIEVINRAFEKIPEESFLFHFFNSFQSSSLCFYMDDFFEGQPSGFFPLYRYLRDHFFFRLEWVRLKLFFKKLQLWCTKIKVLGIVHEVKKKIHVLEKRIRKIAKYPVPQNVKAVRGFLGVLGITRRWIKNFSEMARPLSRLTGKVPWRGD